MDKDDNDKENEDNNAVEVITADEKGDGIIYNLSGQKVTNPVPGIYIRNGKKVIIR